MTIGPDDVDSAETAAGLLYGLAAGEFVAARDQLVRALRAAKRRDLADEVKQLRRPTVIAAELNRVLREAPEEREAVMAAARALAHGHHQLLAGDPVDLAAIQGRHRAAVATLAGRAGAAQRDEVHAALEAASLDESLHARLRAAAFAVEPSPARGFDLLSPAAVPPRPRRALSSVPDPAPAVGSPRQPADPGPDAPPAETKTETQTETQAEATTQAANARRERLEGERAAAAAGVALAERRATATRAAQDQAARRIDELEGRLAEARSHHHEAQRRHDAAEAALDRARAELDRLG